IRELTAAGEQFMMQLAAGETEQVTRLMAAPDEELDLWLELFGQEELSLQEVEPGRLTGWGRGRVNFSFRSKEAGYTAALSLARRGGRWLVTGLPEIEHLQGALVKQEFPGEIALLWAKVEGVGERKFSVSAPAGLNFGEVVEVWAVKGAGDTWSAVKWRRLERISLSRLLRLAEGELEGEREGSLTAARPLPVYLLEGGGARTGRASDLVVGRGEMDLFLDDGQVVAAAAARDLIVPEHIRVVLNDSSYQSLTHPGVEISGDSPFALEARRSGARFEFGAGSRLLIEPSGEGIKVTVPGGEPIRAGEQEIFRERLFIASSSGGRLTVSSLYRPGWGSRAPVYRGALEVANLGGQLTVVNELPLEQYLYAVVPHEMPVSFGEEALKVQSVAARSYAYASMVSSGYSAYGGHLDDSVMSQVYSNGPEHPAANAAVEGTTGLALFYQGAVADTRFFSTSCGYTASAHQVWSDPSSGQFPAPPVPYLQAAPQIEGETVVLGSEEQVRNFLSRRDWNAYDRHSPYFRWKVGMLREELEASIAENLKSRFEAQPGSVLTLEKGGFISREIEDSPLGELKDIRVVQRGKGGNIISLDIEGSAGSYRILKEYNIRAVLRPVQYLSGSSPVVIERHDGTQVAGSSHTLLPSAFASFDLERDSSGRLVKVIIIGGGNGHGVGMSQWGARGMAVSGYGFRDILQHYFPGTDLKPIWD
ncbi:MAG TPA: SpoIID/LytB domain-containing protein, partial [Firmicutes bacterium]|nr:SpoIID/LytB domain-containing protein [Bacillota bacterium]